ncbi:unnamed protein product [Phytophthora lilii]|uniref:Unnamed protein product n=1 Tax=Phytophthora lilii TaxID=2077276 RepID=A0A9W6TZ05_9STRA|nr:unnamed protein product [Phytophthora lilii]
MLSKNGVLPGSQQSTTLVVGVIAVASSLALYASPLAAIKVVLQTRSSASLPFAMILAGTINNLLWVVYGALVNDMFLVVPAVINGALGLVQVALYGVYHSSSEAARGAVVPIEPCQSPKGELPNLGYVVMDPATPHPASIVKPDLEVCSIAIDNSCTLEDNR